MKRLLDTSLSVMATLAQQFMGIMSSDSFEVKPKEWFILKDNVSFKDIMFDDIIALKKNERMQKIFGNKELNLTVKNFPVGYAKGHIDPSNVKHCFAGNYSYDPSKPAKLYIFIRFVDDSLFSMQADYSAHIKHGYELDLNSIVYFYRVHKNSATGSVDNMIQRCFASWTGNIIDVTPEMMAKSRKLDKEIQDILK